MYKFIIKCTFTKYSSIAIIKNIYFREVPHMVENNLIKLLFAPSQAFNNFIIEKRYKKIIILIFFMYLFESIVFSKNIVQIDRSISSLFNQNTINIIAVFSSLLYSIVFLLDSFISAIFYKIAMKLFKLEISLKNLYLINLISQITLLSGKALDLIVKNYSAIPYTSISNVLSKFITNSAIVSCISNIDIFFIWNILLISIGIAVVTKKNLKATLFIVILTNIVTLFMRLTISLLL